jgi:hypothetical protein
LPTLIEHQNLIQERYLTDIQVKQAIKAFNNTPILDLQGKSLNRMDLLTDFKRIYNTAKDEDLTE